MANLKLFIIGSWLLFAQVVFAQVSYIAGRVTDANEKGIEFVNVALQEAPELGSSTDADGYFLFRLRYQPTVTVLFSYVGYQPVAQRVTLLPGDTVFLDIQISQGRNQLPTVVVRADNDRQKVSTFRLDPAEVEQIPLPSGNFESILKTIGLGIATTGGELSAQYSVRGGNFDENLIYVNDFEIYRPQLIRAGQQEGLSFINSDLVSNVAFSSGGFEARYGDKLSSVLDVQYRRPDSLRASVEASLLGGSVHVETVSPNKKFSVLAGARYRTQQYLLNSLATAGQYTPTSADIQALARYSVHPSWELELIANVNDTRYTFIPESRVTSIGTIDNVKELEVFFEGQEVNRFRTMMGGLSATYVGDSNRLRLKFLASAYRSNETETFDVIGDYFLYQVESDLGSNEFNERLFSLGYGTYHDFARNYLVANVANASHKGYYFGDRHLVEWGARYQYETIDDRLNEWQRLDSALYTLPYLTNELALKEVLKTRITLSSSRFSAYLQDTWVLNRDSLRDINLTAGIRGQYWDVNGEFVVSPRAQLSYKPYWERNVIWRMALGMYVQPPFYRELRNLSGTINRDLRAQKSLHFVVGSDYVFEAWDREFRLISEAYFKWLWDLVPYEIEDVKIRYFGDNLARGYAAGIDFRLNGEFVRDAESWITLSIMQTQEDINGDTYLDEEGVLQEIGFIARPTDQRVNVGVLFQDHLPKNDNFKVHLNMLFGTGLPFSPPQSVRFRNALRIPPYRRVDIGFSAQLYDVLESDKHMGWRKHFENLWLSFEVFNLLGIENTISYIWITDNTNTSYAFANFLTNRRLNLRVIAKF